MKECFINRCQCIRGEDGWDKQGDGEPHNLKAGQLRRKLRRKVFIYSGTTSWCTFYVTQHSLLSTNCYFTVSGTSD